MCQDRRESWQEGKDANNWKLYELLYGLVELNHTRWIDNYRTVLSVNGFLLAAAAALLAYVSDNGNHALPALSAVVVFCVLGALVTWRGGRLMKRIRIDMDVRAAELRRLEAESLRMPIEPYVEGREFFFEDEDIPEMAQADYPDKGEGAAGTYKSVGRAICCGYAALLVVAVVSGSVALASGQGEQKPATSSELTINAAALAGLDLDKGDGGNEVGKALASHPARARLATDSEEGRGKATGLGVCGRTCFACTVTVCVAAVLIAGAIVAHLWMRDKRKGKLDAALAAAVAALCEAPKNTDPRGEAEIRKEAVKNLSRALRRP